MTQNPFSPGLYILYNRIYHMRITQVSPSLIMSHTASALQGIWGRIFQRTASSLSLSSFHLSLPNIFLLTALLCCYHQSPALQVSPLPYASGPLEKYRAILCRASACKFFLHYSC